MSSTPLAVGDFDNSGREDVFLSSHNLALNQADSRGNKAPRGVGVINPNITASSSYIAAGDINHDGFEDIVLVANQAAGGFSSVLMLQDTPGHFTAVSQSPAIAASAIYAGIPSIVALNLDGYNDIVVPIQTLQGSSILYALGQAAADLGSFACVNGAQDFQIQQLVVADVDGDGWQDIALPQRTKTTHKVASAYGSTAAILPLSFPHSTSRAYRLGLKER